MFNFHSTVATTIIAFAGVPVIATLPSGQTTSGVAISLSRHSSLLNADDSVNFDALDSHIGYVTAKIARGMDNHERNTRTGHLATVNRNGTRKRGAGIPLLTHKKTFWYGSITIGTSPNPFFVEIDTGSADLIVPAASCDATCEGHTRWDPTKSKNAQLIDADEGCNIRFEDNSMIIGDIYTDNVTIAGFMAKTQTLCAATRYSAQFKKEKFPPDGIMGMAFSSLSTYAASPLFATLVSEHKVTNKMFSFYATSTGGELYVGGANRDLYKDDFVYTPVTKERYWKVKMENIQGKKHGNAEPETIPDLNDIDVIIDTACTLILGDESRIKKIHDALGGEYYKGGYYTYPCDSFPEVKLTFNRKSFPISVTTHRVGPVETGSQTCLSGIISSDSASDFWSIGGVFLQNVYTSFDYGAKQVGFAELR